MERLRGYYRLRERLRRGEGLSRGEFHDFREMGRELRTIFEELGDRNEAKKILEDLRLFPHHGGHTSSQYKVKPVPLTLEEKMIRNAEEVLE